MTRRLLVVSILISFAISLTMARADDAKDATAVLDKAIKALGGEKKLAEIKAATWKGKGKLYLGGNENEFTTQTMLQGLNHLRAEFQANFNGNEVKAITVVAGDKGWRKFADMKMEMDKDAVANEKRMIYLQWIPVTLVPLRTKDFKVALGETESIGGKPATALKVTGPDSKDFTIYFDQQSGLPVRQVAKVIGFTGEEFTQETTIGGYKDFGGVKKATKIESKRDGEKLVEYEISDFKVLEKVEPGAFKEPE